MKGKGKKPENVFSGYVNFLFVSTSLSIVFSIYLPIFLLLHLLIFLFYLSIAPFFLFAFIFANVRNKLWNKSIKDLLTIKFTLTKEHQNLYCSSGIPFSNISDIDNNFTEYYSNQATQCTCSKIKKIQFHPLRLF